jgi:hypothetical protein
MTLRLIVLITGDMNKTAEHLRIIMTVENNVKNLLVYTRSCKDQYGLQYSTCKAAKVDDGMTCFATRVRRKIA